MFSTRAGVCLAAALAVAACSDQKSDVAVVPADSAAVAPGAAPAAAPMDTGMAGMNADMGTVQMTALDNSGVTGQATLTPSGNDTQVMVMLNAGAGKGGTMHQGHIHQGTSCSDYQGVEQPLQPVTLDANGSGSATSSVALPSATLMDGKHVILYHEAGGSPGKPVVCGVIPAHAM